MMARYIDADALVKELERYDDYAIDIVNDQPTADVVKVVRCKDCVHYWKNNLKAEVDDAVAVCLAPPKDDAFCSEGERRDDAET